MDDLQDAIQDAQYIGAMVDPVPRPSRPLKLPKDEEALAFAAHLKETHARALALDTVLSEPLGFYLVRASGRRAAQTGALHAPHRQRAWRCVRWSCGVAVLQVCATTGL